LLTKHLDFEVADKVAPPITQEFNECIESIIRRRILDKAWDDVKKVAAEEPIPYKQKEELQSEKSELGLADLYEKEYVEKTTGVKESDEKLKSKHKELSEIFGKLCYQLDCLSNFHFTPKPVQKEVQIRSNVPAISLEEAIPITMSTASAVAPEELYKSSKAPIGETEITSDEKKSSRRASKRKFKKSEDSKNLVAEGIKNLKSKRRKSAKDSDTLLLSRHNVIKVTSDDKTEYSNSTAFFQKLQDQQSSKSQNNKKHQISSNIDSSETIPNRASRYRL
jgi:U3 small nucleolar RNA-associated protein MPP10